MKKIWEEDSLKSERQVSEVNRMSAQGVNISQT